MRDLEVLYEQVPATRCAGTGDCCALTDEEFDNYYATMFPLYRPNTSTSSPMWRSTFPRSAARSC